MVQDKFNQSKKVHMDKLYLPDKSKKGDVDIYIRTLIDKINSFDDYFTTSSCSGRIILIKHSPKKNQVEWFFVSHDSVNIEKTLEEIMKICNNNSELLWLKVEGFILHVACRNIEKATDLLQKVRDSGFKRSGIISAGNKIMIEILSTETLDVPISENNKLLVSEKYLKCVLKLCNQKLKKTHSRIDFLKDGI